MIDIVVDVREVWEGSSSEGSRDWIGERRGCFDGDVDIYLLSLLKQMRLWRGNLSWGLTGRREGALE
jgi:hypothetical protein